MRAMSRLDGRLDVLAKPECSLVGRVAPTCARRETLEVGWSQRVAACTINATDGFVTMPARWRRRDDDAALRSRH